MSILSDTALVYSVGELNQMVAASLSEAFPSLIVSGEISNFSCPRSGHWYFSLKDKSAQIRCVFFQGQRRSQTLHLTDGMQIIVKARLRLYEIRGDFQLMIEAVERVGDGVLQKKFEALKASLAQDGLFDSQYKKPLPKWIKTVGIITSPSGAAIRDILAVLKRRFPAIEVIIYPTLVQGQEAAQQITNQIHLANQRKECDLLLLSRGGGSLEDLWPFNEEIVARAIFNSSLPIVSAIGHEIDITISDFVADIRAATPSAAAEMISPDQMVWKEHLQTLSMQLRNRMETLIQTYHQRFLMLKRCLRHPGQKLRNLSQQLDDHERRIQAAMQKQWERKQNKLIYLTRLLDSLSPSATLVRGYALVTASKTNRVICNVSQVETGEHLDIQLATGKLLCEVKEKMA